MTCDFISFTTVFQSYRHKAKVMMKDGATEPPEGKTDNNCRIIKK